MTKPILSRRFKWRLKTHAHDTGWLSGNLWLCAGELGGYFEIPASVKIIWLSLYHNEGAERLPLNVKQHYCYPFCDHIVGVFAGGEELVFTDEVDEYLSRLRPYIGKTLYLQVEYED